MIYAPWNSGRSRLVCVYNGGSQALMYVICTWRWTASIPTTEAQMGLLHDFFCWTKGKRHAVVQTRVTVY